MEIQMHQWIKEDTRKVKLMKMSRGYQWEITYENTDNAELIKQLKEIDNELRREYGQPD